MKRHRGSIYELIPPKEESKRAFWQNMIDLTVGTIFAGISLYGFASYSFILKPETPNPIKSNSVSNIDPYNSLTTNKPNIEKTAETFNHYQKHSASLDSSI